MVQGVLGNLVQCGVAAAAAHQVGHIPRQPPAEGDGLRGCPPFSGKQHCLSASGNRDDIVHCPNLLVLPQKLLCERVYTSNRAITITIGFLQEQ